MPLRSPECRLSGSGHPVPWWLRTLGESLQLSWPQSPSPPRQVEARSHLWGGWFAHFHSFSSQDFSRWKMSRAAWKTPLVFLSGNGGWPWPTLCLSFMQYNLISLPRFVFCAWALPTEFVSAAWYYPLSLGKCGFTENQLILASAHFFFQELDGVESHCVKWSVLV